MPAQEILGMAVLAAVLVAALITVGYQLRTGVAPVSAQAAERRDVVALLRRAELGPGARLFEIGCGWGSLALALARAFPGARVVAVELSPVPYLVSRWRARRVPNLEIVRRDLFRVDLAAADAVTCHLMMRPMQRLAEKLDRELRPGTPVVALTFWFRGREREASLQSSRGLRGAAALYRWPAR